MESTYAERIRVARDECSVNGHSLSIVTVYGRLAPQHIFCSRCGTSYRIAVEDKTKDFDRP